MIAKILKNAQSFAGVNYNEKKNEQGKSELLLANNFGIKGDDIKKSDYIKYMEAVCKTNERVKNVQFHAVISCKGRENSIDELRDIAVKYIDKMGYGNNPYLVYFHSDTENNHVHIVSTRVDKMGNKVNDAMERIRSQKVMNEILNIDLGEKAVKDQKNCFDYNFSTIQQYKLLLEKSGWKVSEKDNQKSLYRGGANQLDIPVTQVQDKINVYKPDEQRIKQLSALMHKYKVGLSHLELQKLMKDKFGVDLVFHTGKGHTTPYGYTIIDHANKSVLKGSEVMDLKQIIITPERQQKIDSCNNIVDVIFSDGNKHSMESFKNSIYSYGYKFSMDGNISLKGEKKPLFSLDKDTLKELRYNSRANQANKYNVSKIEEARVLSKLFFVKVDDIKLQNDPHRDFNYIMYSDMMNSYLANSSDMQQTLHDKEISFVSNKGELYLIDKANFEILSSKDLGIDIKGEKEFQRVDILNSSTLDSLFDENEVGASSDVARGHNMIDTLFDIVNQNYNGQEDKKRKKKRGQQQD